MELVINLANGQEVFLADDSHGNVHLGVSNESGYILSDRKLTKEELKTLSELSKKGE